MDPPRSLRALTAHVVAYRFQLENERMRAMDRLTEKLLKAGGVVGRLTAKLEAKADAVIARETVLDQKTEHAFDAHHAMLDDAGKALEAFEAKLALVSNDPLESSGRSQGGDRVALGPHPDVANGATTFRTEAEKQIAAATKS
jgi:hypothetical protein